MSTLAVTNIKHESADTNSIVLNSDGNVGIGTATPSSPLHVVGDTRTTSINSGPLAGFRNAIINGNFDFWQRGTSFTGSELYGSDRWIHLRSGTTHTVTREAFALGQTDVPNEPTFWCRTVVSSVAGANNLSVLLQKIEGVRTFAGQQVTVSFYAKADAAKNIAVELTQSFGDGGSASAEVNSIGVTKVSIGTGWQEVTVTATLPSISGKTLGTNNNDSLILIIFFDAGSTFNSRTDTLGHQSGTFNIAQVQVELGPVATPFERRPLGTELALCQRYFETGIAAGPTNNDVFFNAGAVATALYSFTQTKRSTPTISVTDGQGNANRFSGALGGAFANQTITGGAFAEVLSPGAFVTDFASASAGNRYSFNWQASAEL